MTYGYVRSPSIDPALDRRGVGDVGAVIQGVNLLNGAIEFEWTGSAYVQVTSGALL